MTYLQTPLQEPYGTAEKAASFVVGRCEAKMGNGRDSEMFLKSNKVWASSLIAKSLVLLALLGTLLLTRVVSRDSLHNQQQQPALSFSLTSPFKDPSFQITIFADLHFGEEPSTIWGPEQDVNTTRAMEAVLSHETPDLVVLLGDLITSDKRYRLR